MSAAKGGRRHLRKRSFSLAGHRTSVALEPEFWAALEAEAARQGSSLAALVARLDAARAAAADAAAVPLASALRVFALARAPGAARALDAARTPGAAHAPGAADAAGGAVSGRGEG